MRKKLFVLELLPECFQSGTYRSFWRADAVGGLESERVKESIIHGECVLGEPMKKLLKD